MMRDITIGQYYPADSILHRLDPRVKFVSTLVYIVLPGWDMGWQHCFWWR